MSTESHRQILEVLSQALDPEYCGTIGDLRGNVKALLEYGDFGQLLRCCRCRVWRPHEAFFRKTETKEWIRCCDQTRRCKDSQLRLRMIHEKNPEKNTT